MSNLILISDCSFKIQSICLHQINVKYWALVVSLLGGLHHLQVIALLLCVLQRYQRRENHPHQQAHQEPAQLLRGPPGRLLQGELPLALEKN